jgi:hypothetical protein
MSEKKLFILLLLTAVLIAWFYLTKQATQKLPILEPTNTVAELPPQQLETNFIEVTSNTAPVEAVQQPTNAIEPTVPLTNALIATNIEQWKAAIQGLKKEAGFITEQHWLVEQPGRKAGLPINLSLGDKTVQYSAVLISVTAKNEIGDIMEVEMQSPNMNIHDTRELGLQLCNMLGVDPKDFLAWCDKVGNHWLDAPLYAGGNRNYSFQILNGYNDEKPWLINFMITPNP